MSYRVNEAALREAAERFPTPFYLYDGDAIAQRCRDFNAAFAWSPGYREFFAVKALPNPRVMGVIAGEGCGMDCASVAELELAKRIGVDGSRVVFTSNNTVLEEFAAAAAMGAMLNIDAVEQVDKLVALPGRDCPVAVRYNPGKQASSNVIIGDPAESKFGCTREQTLQAFARLAEAGYQRFGVHGMLVSAELSVDALAEGARLLLELAAEVHAKTGVAVGSVNIGGGVGIPYREGERDVDLAEYGRRVEALHKEILVPIGLKATAIHTECGRAMTGPFGVLVTKVTNVKRSYKTYVGVDASMSNLMRPGMYGAYHRVSLLGDTTDRERSVVDVVGSLCENNDKFAIDREMPMPEVGDTLIVHEAGAHAHSMGFQYNGRLRSAEYLYRADPGLQKIRRAETLDDYFATLQVD